MLIGELSRKTGLSKDTIRFYEKRGMISLGYKQRRANNYKEYSDEVFDRLQVIKRIKHLGFTLNEITDFLALIDMKEATCHYIAGRITEKVALLDLEIEALTSQRRRLLAGMQQCMQMEQQAAAAPCPILIQDELP